MSGAEDGPERWERRAIDFINAHKPPVGAAAGSRVPTCEVEEAEWRRWTVHLHQAGLAVMGWPRQWGGAEACTQDVLAVQRVLRAAGAPLPLTDVAINMVGPAIMSHGGTDQQRRLLPDIASGEAVWTQLFSEPDAGSDLAALRTKATPTQDGGWVLSGQKVWNTYASIAQYGYLLARTDPTSQRHHGLTLFLVPMDSPGVKVVPIREITGCADFNEVFFDDVCVPADAVLGTVGCGWQISMDTLADERAVVGALVSSLAAESSRLAEVLTGLVDEAHGEHVARFVTILADISALTAIVEDEPGAPAGMQALGKVLFSEINVALHQLALDVSAAFPGAVCEGWQQRWADSYLYTRGYTISGGANEVLRNVMAKRGMGLGRG
jgi:alkylation response protein AidB-like acyl-CoA dehydrogenase